MQKPITVDNAFQKLLIARFDTHDHEYAMCATVSSRPIAEAEAADLTFPKKSLSTEHHAHQPRNQQVRVAVMSRVSST
jgi:hypothetical protein